MAEKNLTFEHLCVYADQVFGSENWSHVIKNQTIDFEKEDKTRKVTIGCFTIVRVSYQDERHHEGVGFYEGTFETKGTAFKEVRTKSLVDAMYNTLISFKEIRDYFENLEKKKVERIKRQNELKQQWISNNFDSKKTMINESENTHHLKN
ncbi:DNA repair and recombination protein RAD52-like [Cotesia glomerata]|uniref:DNA repair and recombination protein RAD52-like n=1 Tax=Cotesia glomerata TaxID=32391 RepID=UPI001D007E17|nr:DNA repair and recombination protein RAD52-like [Cotesia glomerata]XP_044597575.1 DNA repair and recombination protein RAD52-like [Cotesia glomerata]